MLPQEFHFHSTNFLFFVVLLSNDQKTSQSFTLTNMKEYLINVVGKDFYIENTGFMILFPL